MSITVNGTNGLTFNDASTQNTAATGFGFKNRIINGNMVLDQRNAGASVTPANGQYLVDRFTALLTQTNKFSVQQNAGGIAAPSGFSSYLGVTSLSAFAVSGSDILGIGQYIEGFNTSDLGFGTANAQVVTLSFRVYSSLTGTFGGVLQNSAATRSYPFTYTIASANTWTSISITIAGDTAGTWIGSTNGVGLRVIWGLGCGPTVSGTAGSWASSGFYSATGATSVVGTPGATFYITGVQLEKGSTATSFDYRPYGTELALCQRYCYVLRSTDAYARFQPGYNPNVNSTITTIQYPQTMRAQPSLSWSGAFSEITVGGATGTVATLTSDGNTLNYGAINFNYSAGTVGLNSIGACRINGTTNWYAAFNSEL